MESRPRPKRRRTSAANAQDEASHVRKPVLVNLPVELVADILLYTNSTKDVLAVARTCKFLCNTLLRREAAYIWRYTRLNCLPGPLPDPKKVGLSESAFAAMLFDPGTCANCSLITHNMFSSFSLRIRFCARPECQQRWTPKNITRVDNPAILRHKQRSALEWLPLAEAPSCFWFPAPRLHVSNPLSQSQQPWPNGDKGYLNDHMNAAMAEFDSYTADIVRERHAKEKERQEARMTFYVEVWTWRGRRVDLARTVHRSNEALSKQLAKEAGYEYNALIQGSQTYNALRLQKNKTLELIVEKDFTVVADVIEAEILAFKEREERRAKEATIRANRAQVEEHYHRLLTEARTPTPPIALPSLTEFRTMPILRLLQSPDASSSATSQAAVAFSRKANATRKTPTVTHDLKNKETLVSKLLDSELDKWRRTAERDLGVILGFPAEWKTAKSNVLHPVKRLTARWTCKKCGKVGRAYKWDECMDFDGVCRHECPGSRESKHRPRKESIWASENFVKDEQAVGAMTKLVQLCGIDAENPNSFEKWNAIGARVVCLSCPSAIIMRPSDVVGHSHRHEMMDFEILEQRAADKLVAAPVEQRLAKYLLGGTDDKKVKKAKELWSFGCRHCEQERPTTSPQAPSAPPPPAASEENEDKEDGEEVEEHVRGPKFTKKKAKRFNLNGLRSHLKEKHKIGLACDEDFYHVVES
ncbi:hypothetical protein C8F01DRAFT_1027474 [Mycena amicta]|nr:hypothetical protein C8F01DRAFT_1027474 [Mycena amicta]